MRNWNRDRKYRVVLPTVPTEPLIGETLPLIITQLTAPTFGPYTSGDTPEDAYTAGSYTSTAGTISSIVPSWEINGSPALGTDVLASGDVVGLSVLVTDSAANQRTFSYGVADPAAGIPSGFVIVSSNPADNATGVLNTVNPTITFSAPVVPGTGLITLRQNISGVWSDLETFDMATEAVLATDAAGAGAGQVYFSGPTIYIHPSTILIEGREYAIRIAATAIDDINANSFAGIANDTTLSFTTAAQPFVARFGPTGTQPANSGNFDTNLYTSTPPANGTYGNFSVTAGVISCNGSQTVGTYSVGGYPVEVLNDFRAVTTLTEMNAAIGFSGPTRTLCIREGTPYSWDNRTVGNFGRRVNLDFLTILGDGPDVRANKWNTSYDSRAHFIRVILGAVRRFTCRNLRIVPNGGQTDACVNLALLSGGGVDLGDVNFDKCLFIAHRPNPNGNYTAGTTSFGGNGFAFFAGIAPIGLTLTDNVAMGGLRNYRIAASAYVEMIGNESWLSYEDGYQYSLTTPTITAGCLMGIGLAKPGDSGNPHGDGIQIQPGVPAQNHIIEACGMFAGDHRGRTSNQAYFLDNSTDGYLAWMRDSLLIDDPTWTFSITNTQGSIMEHLAWAPTPYTTLPDNTNGIRFGNLTPVTGTNILRNCVEIVGGGVNASVTRTGNVQPLNYLAADWEAMYEDWTVDREQYPSLQKIMADLRTKATGPGNGKGHRVTFSGSENSSFVIDGGSLTTPTLSALTITSTVAASVSATITTNVPLNPIYFAIVPQGQAVVSPRDIKRRRVTGGIIWRYTSVGNDTLSGIVLSAAGAGLVAGTTYDLVAEQENGWTKVSTVARVTFTAT
jgi:hypothetical protein